MSKTIKVVAISDTHGLHHKLELPEGDILVHAGDIAFSGHWDGLSSFNDWLGRLPYRHKVVIAGNHDFWFEREPERARAALTNAVYLQDEMVTLDGLTIYGSPWQPRFGGWAFNLPRGPELAKVWAKIPERIDILLTHGPPAQILDRTAHGHFAGCEELAKRVAVVKPRFHVFGHIHEGYGQHRQGETDFLNASVVDMGYRLSNAPFVLNVALP